MVLFWDKNVPKTIPQALSLLKPPVGIEIYLDHFPLSDMYPEGGDDKWLSEIGPLDWIVVTQDWNLHNRQNELFALKQYKVGCFYLWGSEAPKWETMRCFARAYDNIVEAAVSTPKPFIYRVTQSGRLEPLSLP